MNPSKPNLECGFCGITDDNNGSTRKSRIERHQDAFLDAFLSYFVPFVLKSHHLFIKKH